MCKLQAFNICIFIFNFFFLRVLKPRWGSVWTFVPKIWSVVFFFELLKNFELFLQRIKDIASGTKIGQKYMAC